MPGETFVDVSYRGLELGRRHKLHEVGPTTAYLEHPSPMPVGTRLELLADGGVALTVEVVRVHEQVAGTERPPGMRVKAPALDDRAGSLWRSLISAADWAPAVIAAGPTRSAVPVVLDDSVDTTVVELDAPRRRSASVAPPVAVAVAVVAHVDAAAPPVEAAAPVAEVAERAGKTEVMSAVDVEAIMATADEPGESSASRSMERADAGGTEPSATEPAGKKKRGGGGRRKKKKDDGG